MQRSWPIWVDWDSIYAFLTLRWVHMDDNTYNQYDHVFRSHLRIEVIMDYYNIGQI